MRRIRHFTHFTVLGLALLLGSSATHVQANGKPTAIGTQATQACLTQGSTVVLKSAAGVFTIAFANGTSCSRFFAHNPGLTVQSVTPGFHTAGLTPTGTQRLHGNSTAAQFCPTRGATATVSFRTANSTTVGTAAFMNPLKSHGQCVSFFARNKSLMIVTH
jgi:hypothetical protein